MRRPRKIVSKVLENHLDAKAQEFSQSFETYLSVVAEDDSDIVLRDTALKILEGGVGIDAESQGIFSQSCFVLHAEVGPVEELLCREGFQDFTKGALGNSTKTHAMHKQCTNTKQQ